VSATAVAYRHDALTYSGEDDFVRRAGHFLSTGLALGEPALLISDPRRLWAVREVIGTTSRDLRLIDTTADARNPAVLLSVLCSFADQADGRRCRGLGDIARPGLSDALAAEQQLHELLLNTPVANNWNMWMACSYDTSLLTADDVESVLANHPAQRVDMTNVLAAKFGSELPARPGDTESFPVNGRDLSTVRAIVRTAATMAGLDEDRADNFVYAVNEVVTNSIRHAGGAAEMALWMADGDLVCEVQDGGHIADPLTGRIPPGLSQTSGRGLWMVNQLCDLVQVRSPARGTCVRMYIGP
jgi:anti-sigma regulatory factor (Ser/Thr protein kinase)